MQEHAVCINMMGYRLGARLKIPALYIWPYLTVSVQLFFNDSGHVTISLHSLFFIFSLNTLISQSHYISVSHHSYTGARLSSRSYFTVSFHSLISQSYFTVSSPFYYTVQLSSQFHFTVLSLSLTLQLQLSVLHRSLSRGSAAQECQKMSRQR